MASDTALFYSPVFLYAEQPADEILSGRITFSTKKI
jgi:hypothetical protein